MCFVLLRCKEASKVELEAVAISLCGNLLAEVTGLIEQELGGCFDPLLSWCYLALEGGIGREATGWGLRCQLGGSLRAPSTGRVRRCTATGE